jgi:hypothetical protein
MINKKILIIGSYPIKEARHGGQKRLEAIVDNYKSFIKEVKFTAVFHKATYPIFSLDDICLGQKSILDEVDNDPQYYELIIGDAPNRDIHARSYMAKLLLEYRPDILHIEQPYLYSGMKVLLDELNIHPFLIFGSENIEAPLKDQILKDSNYDQTKRTDIVSKVDAVERSFTKDASLVIAVSNSDEQAHKSMGARHCIVAPNGISKSKSSRKMSQYWTSYKKTAGVSKIVTFIGSGHPPNYKGFLELVGSDSSFLRNKNRIIIAGGVGEYFKITFKKTKENSLFWKKIDAVGFLDEGQLSGLIDTSDVIILPITSGGGSNLKTAEAILSGKKIVATSFAFRGFEYYLSLPNIYIADTPETFRQAINDALESLYVERKPKEIALAERVEWSNSLSSIKPAVQYLMIIHDLRAYFTKGKSKVKYFLKKVATKLRFS